MRRVLKNLLKTLDGAPLPDPASGRSRRGQSLVELTLVMPILIIMLLGLIEIAWLANHFLILMDVTRSAARAGALLDPTEWQEGDERFLERMDCDRVTGGAFIDADNQVYLPVQDYSHLPAAWFMPTGGESSQMGFYDSVACRAVQDMSPLVFDTKKDDLVISVFSFLSQDLYNTGDVNIYVTGRLPAHQNECSNETYDPFDVNNNGLADATLENMDLIWDTGGPFDNTENIRGYVLTGHHQVSDAPGCIGSEFSTEEIEAMLNGASSLENSNTPNNGLVVVEMFWHHRQLLGLRFFTIIGDDFELHVWSMYPVTAAEPTATFDTLP